MDWEREREREGGREGGREREEEREKEREERRRDMWSLEREEGKGGKPNDFNLHVPPKGRTAAEPL